MRRTALQIFSFALLLSPTLWSQESDRRLKADMRRPLRVDYQSNAWNKNKNTVETEFLLIRDAKSGRMATVEITETEPDSGLFKGSFQLNFQGSGGQDFEMIPEVYILPKEMAKGGGGLKTANAMIKEGQLLRKPYFLRVEKNDTQVITVFDKKEQALEAYQGYLKTASGRQVVDRAAMEVAQNAQEAAEAKARAEAAARAEAERQSIEVRERQRQEELKRKQAELDAKEKAARKAQAVTLSQEAFSLYQKEDFAEAEKKFQAATELDPENQSYYFQYGVTLYKTEKYQKSLVILDLVKSSNVSAAELEYYKGLNFLKLKEYTNAHANFVSVKNRNDENLSAPASFFAGVIDYQNEKYDEARSQFEYVLDRSKDPKMDQQAEAYIEQIANIKQFQELQKKKFFINANLGMMYDSNILSVSAANAPTDLAGWRFMYGGSVEYRAIYTAAHELSVTVGLNDMYSLDKSFKASSTFQNTDPLVSSVSLPYRWKGEMLGKAYQLSLSPSYTSIQMNADGSGARENILNSTGLGLDQTFVMNDDWFATYKIEYAKDDSFVSGPSEDNQNSTRLTLGTSQAWFFDAKKTTAFIFDLGYAMNKAEGQNQTYNRIDSGFTYMAPLGGEWLGTSRLGVSQASYTEHLVGRSDTMMSLTLAGRRPIEKLFFWNLSASYMNNDSIEKYKYNKFMVMSSLSWDQNF